MIPIIVTACFFLGLWLSNSFVEPRLSLKQLLVVAVVCTLLAFIPVVGVILSLVAGAFLIYRLSDVSLGYAWLIMLLSRGLAVLVALGISQAMEKRPEERGDDLPRQLSELQEAGTTSQKVHDTQ